MAKISISPADVLTQVQKMEELLADAADQESRSGNVVGDLGAGWKGQDYTLFLAHYASTMVDSSTYVQTYQMIANYLNYVRAAAYLYSKAATAAEKEANAITGDSFTTCATEAQSILTEVISSVSS